MHALFQDAVAEELIASNPCVLKKGELPKMIDKDPAWRPTAVFARSELETLISDERIPHDRRMLYALEFLTGARPSEVSVLTWASYDTETEPLGKLVVAFAYDRRNKKVKSTKTQVTREVPVHPTLAKILAEWNRARARGS